MVKNISERVPGQTAFDFAFPSKKSIKLITVDEIYDSLATIELVDAKEDRRIDALRKGKFCH